MKHININKCLSVKKKNSLIQCTHKRKKDSLFCGIHKKSINPIKVFTLTTEYDCSNLTYIYEIMNRITEINKINGFE